MTKQTHGICQICGHRTTKGPMLRHLQTCIEAHDPGRGPGSPLYQLRIEARYQPAYWLDLEVKAKTELAVLDQFLRETWLECCGHMSAFHIDEFHYIMPYDGSFEVWEAESDMNVDFGAALHAGIQDFEYEYDFGSTTLLKLRVIASRKGRIGRQKYRLLARNEPMEWQCVNCDKQAVSLCPICIYDGYALFCKEHIETHDCNEDYYLPVVNSPRMGVCGYEGPGEW